MINEALVETVPLGVTVSEPSRIDPETSCSLTRSLELTNSPGQDEAAGSAVGRT